MTNNGQQTEYNPPEIPLDPAGMYERGLKSNSVLKSVMEVTLPGPITTVYPAVCMYTQNKMPPGENGLQQRVHYNHPKQEHPRTACQGSTRTNPAIFFCIHRN